VGDVLVFFFVFGLIVAIVIVQRARRASLDQGARNALMAAQYDSTAAVRGSVSLEPLRARDPALTEQSIADHVLPMADMLRRAWCAGDMRSARSFVSDGVYSRFQVQLALMRQENRRNVMEDARVLATTIEAVEDAAPLDVVHVRVVAEARDTEVPVGSSDEAIRHALARTPLEPYSEIWSLVRRTGAQTKQAGFAVGRACPSCGAPFGDGEQGETLKCRYCGALVCSGEHDWVLAEITQLEEWHPSSRRAPGLDGLRARDGGVAREALEDRASYLFWKWVQAGRVGTSTPLRKCAAPSLLVGGGRIDWTQGASDVAVGGAELLACELGEPAAESALASNARGRDRVHVKIFWSARFGGSPGYTPVQTVLSLGRTAGVVSKLSMTALVCQACGAPLVDSDTTKCDHCGAELAAGDQTWVLDAVLRPDELRLHAPSDSAATQLSDAALGSLVPDVADPRERRILFARMAQLMAADGTIDRRERRLLQMCASRWGIAPEDAEEVLASPPRGDYGAALGVHAPEWFLAGLVAAALADGRVDARERTLLEHACDALRLPHEVIDRQIAWAAQRARA
jgi:tellurite resistance protein